MNDDFLDILTALLEREAEFVVVGAHALAIHGAARATGDIDIFVRPSPENAHLVYRALEDFGAPLSAHGLSKDLLAKAGTVYQIGLPPRRIDILTQIDGVGFDEAWKTRVHHQTGHLTIPFLGREELVRNKRAAARPKDLLDLALLEEMQRLEKK